MRKILYNLIRTLLYIVLGIGMIFSTKLKDFIMKRLFQKVDIEGKLDTVWVHCASVGEVNLAEPIIKKFIDETSDQIILTMMTDTGRGVAEKKYSGNKRVKLLYFPLDDCLAIKKILKRIVLKKLVIIETEIWPNLINMCSKRAKVVMINGRISDRSIKSYTRIKFLLKNLFKNIETFIMQTEQDRERIIFLGAIPKRVYNYGNLKFNIELPTYTKEELNELKESLGVDGRRVFVAGSTRDDEEEYILEAFDELKETLLILVPRHIERTDDICERLLENKYEYRRWTDIYEEKVEENIELIRGLSKKKIGIVIVDKIGELRKLYAICDIAYVGGTLVDIGGHSLLEPLFYRKPPIFGPYIQNVRNIAKEVISRKIGTQVRNGEELKKVIMNYDLEISNDKKIKQNIDKFFLENSHVVEMTFKKLIQE